MPKNFETVVELTGKIDPSVAKVVGLSVKELYKINQAYNTIAKLQKQANLAANGLPPVLAKTTVEIAKSNRAAQELGNSLRRVHEIAAGVFEAEAFLGALEKGLSIVEEMGAKIKEFGISSLEVRGKREILQNQQRSMLESLGRGGQFGDLDMMLRNMEGRETMIKYSQLMAATNRLESSAPDRFNSVDSVHSMLAKLSDVSKDTGTFDLATQALTRILAAGKLDAKHIQELGFDTGYSFGPAIAKALNMTPENMTEAMKKHKISGSQGIDALFKAFDIITGPGGAAYKHAEAQLKGWEGIVARWEGHLEDFKESFGKQLENFFYPIAEEIFKYLTPAALTHAFDGLEQFSEHMGEMASALFSGVFVPLETKLPLFFSGIQNPLQAFSNWVDSFFVEVSDPVNGLHSVLKPEGFNAVNSFVDGAEKMFAEISKLVTSKAVQDLSTTSVKVFVNAMEDLLSGLNEMADLYKDLFVDHDWGKAISDIQKYKDKDKSGSSGHGASGSWEMPAHNGIPYSDEPGRVYYEHPDTEGSSSQFGPMGNLLGYGYGVGLGVAQQKETGATFGKWVRIRLPNGSTIVRQVNETSSRPSGIEFVTPHTDESSYGNGRATIEGVYDTKPQASAGDTHVHFHIDAIDGASVRSFLDSHGDRIARHVHESIRDRLSATAAV